MNSVILQYVCVSGAVLLTLLFVFVWLNEKGVNPFEEIIGRYRRLPRFAQFLLPVLIAHLIVYGSTKAPTNDVSGGESSTNGVAGGSSMTNAPSSGLLGLMPPSLGSAFSGGFSTDEIAAGHVLWRVGTNEVWSFDLMPGAQVVENWRLRGAAEDWALCATTNLGPVAMTTDGRLVTTNGVFAAFDGRLAIVPEVHWRLLGTNAPSRAWWVETPWQSTVFTWENAFLGRDTNVPVSVQAEFMREGDFIYRYDLAAAGTNLTSLLYYHITDEDLMDADRDGDGLTTWDEINLYHSDPGLVDSEGDGLLDAVEILNGTDPTVRSVPNGEILARVAGSSTNENYRQARRPNPNLPFTTLKLWDGFAADCPSGTGTLVYERTLNLGTANGWQHYFLSSKETEAGDWSMRGLLLEWEDGNGGCGSVTASPLGDSFPLPVTGSTVTIRLRVTEPKIQCLKPMYLVGYAPVVSIAGGRTLRDEDDVERGYLLSGTNRTLSVTIDRSHRPCKAALGASEMSLPGLANLTSSSGGALAYEGSGNGGTIRMMRPGYGRLPSFAVDDPFTPAPRLRMTAASAGSADDGDGLWIICLDPSVDFSGEHRFVKTGIEYNVANGDYCITYRYPLDSKCLWRSWQRTVTGHRLCFCNPEVKTGRDVDDLPFVEKICEVNGNRTEATGIIRIFGEEVWRGTAAHSWRDVGRGGGTSTGSMRLSEWNPCDEDCDDTCTDGNCDMGSGTDLNSVKFRLSLGMPRQGQHSGFVYFESEGPVAVTTALLQVMSRDDASVSDTSSGSTRTVVCSDRNGRCVAMEPMANGVRLTVTEQASGTLDETWEIVNAGGDTNVVRITQISRLNNVMSDETFAVDADGVWTKTDNISGVVEMLERVDLTNDPTDGKLYETRTKYDADGNRLDRVSTESSRIGEFGNAVLRETYWEQDTGCQVKWRAAEYWNDAAHRDRHGQLRLLTGNCTAWEYHDYDARGFETLRVEQRNGSSVPTAFPEEIAGELLWAGGLSDAFVTVFDYTPFAGDGNHPDEIDQTRCETRYVVVNGIATCIARTWTRYTHVVNGGLDALKTETWRASSATASLEDPANAYSYVIACSETAEGIPLVLRSENTKELDEDGTLTENEVEVDGDVIRMTIRKSDERTYEVVERDGCFGNELRRAKYLKDYDELIDEEISTYDDKNRLRSTTYADGTSLTNAFSCCRKLWSSDREGRKTLRSAVTGQDRLYYAEEEVWLRELSTNGEHKVTQHFFDGLGRETGTVVYSATAAGEATSATASEGKTRSVSTVSYPYGGDDYSVAVDVRGKTTVRERQAYEDREESVVAVYAAEAAASSVQTQTTQYRGGGRVTEKTWGDKWTREIEIEEYTSGGCAVRYEVAESSDYGTVTNRIVTCDFLGRTVLEVTPKGTTATTYHGAKERADVTTFTAGNIVRVSTTVYDDWNKEVGNVQDGVTNRTDTCYKMDGDGIWWKVTRNEVRSGDEVGSETERREQLTGRASGVIGRQVDIDSDGVVEETVERWGVAEGERVTSVSNAVSGAMVQTRRFGVVQAIETPDGTRQFATDSIGRQVAETRYVSGADGIRVLPCETREYDAAGDVIVRHTYTNEAAFVSETYDYDCFGRRVRAVDALGNEKETAYDAVGNVVEESGATYPVRHGYDTAGRRISLSTTKDGRIWDVTTWSYDPMTGKCTAKRYPDASQVAYSYTPDGLPLVTTLASGRTTTDVYDAKRMQVGSLLSDGAGDATYAYDAFGKMTSASNAAASYAYAPHRNGIITNETVTVGETSRGIVRTIDAFGRLSGRQVSGGAEQTITYDAANRVATIATTDAVAAYVYGDDGTDLGLTLTLANGTVVTRQIARDDYRQQVVSVSNFVNGAAVGGFAYGRDALGRIVRRDEAGGDTTTFAYDEVGQVVQVSICPLLSTSYQLSSYSYDQIGNIAGSETLAYTTDGGVAGLDGKTFAYDSAMRLTTVTTGGVTVASYAYDAFGRRVRKTTPAAMTLYFYDGWNLVREETSGADGGTVEYVWGKDIAGSLDTAGGIGGLLYLKRNGTIYVPLYDANGNVIAYVDATGSVVSEYAYDAFGNEVTQTTNSPTANHFSFRYSTKYWDAETGFYYYGYRYYAPTAARWLTRDPLEEQGGFNFHAFCENDGVNKYDWLGLKPAEPSMGDDVRRFWHLVAQMLGAENFPLTALFIENSFEHGTNHRGEYRFNSGSELSKEIKKSTEYKDVFDKTIRNLSIGRHIVEREPTNFPDAELVYARECDLQFSVKKARVKFDRGVVCKQAFGGKGKPGGDKVSVNISVTGEFQYDQKCLKILNSREKEKRNWNAITITNGSAEEYAKDLNKFKWTALIEERR